MRSNRVNWIPETDEKIKDVKIRGFKDFVEEDEKKTVDPNRICSLFLNGTHEQTVFFSGQHF